MPKSYRTDITGKPKFAEEIQHYKKATPERVQCPSPGCECSYEMYGHTAADRESNTATLKERILREHPDHTSEVLAVNQFRKRPR